MRHDSGQIIATSHDLTPYLFGREIPMFQGNPGWWNITRWWQLKYFSCSPPGKWSNLTCAYVETDGLVQNHQLVIELIFWKSFNHTNPTIHGSVNIPAPWRIDLGSFHLAKIDETPREGVAAVQPRLGPQNDISGLLGAGGKKTCGKTLMFLLDVFWFGEAVFWSYRMLGFFYHVSTLKKLKAK